MYIHGESIIYAQEDFEEDIMELNVLYKLTRGIPKHFKQYEVGMAKYRAKLKEIGGKYHMEKEDIVQYLIR